MIIFFDKSDGRIVGSLEGRVHNADHLKMWIGDSKTTDRLIIEWEYNQKNGEYEPPKYYSDIAKLLEDTSSSIYDYKVDLKTKKIVKKSRS